MKFIQKHLFLKLLLSYGIIIAVGAIVLFSSVMFLTPRAYMRHMRGGIMMPNQAMGQMVPPNTQTLSNFREGLIDAIGWSLLASGVVGFGVSILFSKQIIKPLNEFNSAAMKISQGNYSGRIRISSKDEFGKLADSFNEMTEKIQSIEDTRIRLIGDISHELRTPLTIVRGYLEGLSDGVLEPEKQTYDILLKETNRLTRLVNDLQELSKVESGVIEIKKDLVNFGKLLENITTHLQPLFSEKNIQLNLQNQAHQQKIFVVGDEDRFVQVLTNILGNALQYSPEGSKVDVICVCDGKLVNLSIKDQGVGLLPDDLQRVFERFYRVDRSRNRESGNGSGIGLSIAKALIELQGGQIWAESDGIGKGTTFRIVLPIATV